MAPLKRKRPRDEAPAAPIPVPEATTRRATRQTSTAPVPMQLDTEPRKRRRRANTNEDEEGPATSQPVKSTRRTSPSIHGKENIPAVPSANAEPLKPPLSPATRGTGLKPSTTTSASVKTGGLKATRSTQPAAKPTAFPPDDASVPPISNDTTKPQQHRTGTTKPRQVATSGAKVQSQPKATHPYHSHSSASPANRKGTIPSTDRNIDKVVLGDICFRAWYPSYYPKELLGDHSSATTSTIHPAYPQPSHHAGAGSKDWGAKGSTHRHRDHHHPPLILDRLCVCPCCFKYSKELVSWWEHVRICEAREHVPGRKIYTHPRGQQTVLVPAPGTVPGPKIIKGGKRGSVAARMVEEVVKDEGEWSIWEVDGEKEGLFCQNLSLFAKLFLDNKSVFFDVTGFNYFLLVYTPAPKPSPFHDNTPSTDRDPSVPRQHIVGFFSKEKMSWDNNNLACILIFPPWQRKGLGSLLMGISYEISRREGVLGGPEKPISDLGKKGYKRFWGGEIARWLLSLEVRAAGKEDDDDETVVDVEACSKGTWIAVEDCLAVLRDMGVVEDAGKGVDPRSVNGREGEGGEGEAEKEVAEVKMVDRVRVDKAAVRRWVAANGISLERSCDPRGFVEGYAVKSEEEESEE